MVEDGYWSLKGPFKDAMEEDEEIEWVHSDGKPLITICAVSSGLTVVYVVNLKVNRSHLIQQLQHHQAFHKADLQ